MRGDSFSHGSLLRAAFASNGQAARELYLTRGANVNTRWHRQRVFAPGVCAHRRAKQAFPGRMRNSVLHGFCAIIPSRRRTFFRPELGLSAPQTGGLEATGLGVIDSLSAGYRFLGRRLELLLIPVALDILLWLGPRFSVAPLSERLAGFYAEAARMEGVPPDMAAMTAQVA